MWVTIMLNIVYRAYGTKMRLQTIYILNCIYSYSFSVGPPWATKLVFRTDAGPAPKGSKCTHIMMVSSSGNIFCVTGPIWGEFTGHRWIPFTKASDVELWCFLWSAPEQTIKTPVIWYAIALIVTSLYWLNPGMEWMDDWDLSTYLKERTHENKALNGRLYQHMLSNVS